MARRAPIPPQLPLIEVTSVPPSPDSPTMSLRPLFWSKVVPTSKNTVWQNVLEQQKHVSFNEDTFLKLFQKIDQPFRMRCASPLSPCRVLNDTKFQAIQILLRNIPWEDIIKVMGSLKYMEECSFDVNILANVATMITTNEVKRLRSCSTDSLEQPERLVLRLFNIENFREKVMCLRCMSQFQDIFPTLKQQINALNIAYKLLYKPDDKLCQVLALILMIGNRMNLHSTSRSNAYGYKLEILPELKDVRSFDGSSNLLQFIVQSYIDCHSVTDDGYTSIEFPLPDPCLLISAVPISVVDLRSNCKFLESEMEACKKYCFLKSEPDCFRKEMMAFIEESSNGLAYTLEELQRLDILFNEVVCFYCLEETVCMTSQNFLQKWISFIQSFTNYWDTAIAHQKWLNAKVSSSQQSKQRSYPVPSSTTGLKARLKHYFN